MIRRYTIPVVVIAFTVWAFASVGFDLERIRVGIFVKPFFGEFISGMWPFNWEILPDVLRETVVTVQIAWVGTLLAVVISLPLSFVAARNITPGNLIGSSVRFFFNVDRSIDVLIVALVLVAAVGLGELAGTLAIAVHSVGSMGKLFTEAIESIDRGPVEAIESTGATRAQVVRWGVAPQVLPYVISYFLYRLELNIRSAVVLGLVGAGGIGFLLADSIRQFEYTSVSMILLVIVTLVMAIDAVSARLRSRVG